MNTAHFKHFRIRLGKPDLRVRVLMALWVGVSLSTVARIHAQNPPERAGQNILVVTKDATPVVSNDAEKPVVVFRLPKDARIPFFGKVGPFYQISFRGNLALIPAENILVVQRAKIPGWSDEKNQMLDEAEEYIVLASRLQDLGDNRNAIPLMTKAVELLTGTLGEAHGFTATHIGNLGLVYRAIGELKKSDELLTTSVDVYRKVGATPKNMAIMIGNLAWARGALGDFGSGQQLFKEAIQLAEKELPSNDRSLGILLNNYADLLEKHGFHTEAYGNYPRSLEITKATDGQESASYAMALSNLAVAAKSLGNYHDALAKLEESIRLSKQLYGEDHRSIGSSLANLGVVLDLLGDIDAAVKVSIKAAQIS